MEGDQASAREDDGLWLKGTQVSLEAVRYNTTYICIYVEHIVLKYNMLEFNNILSFTICFRVLYNI